MKKYSVYWNNNVECNKVAEFATLDEAKAYCAENTKDYDEIGDGDFSCANHYVRTYPHLLCTLVRSRLPTQNLILYFLINKIKYS